MVNTSKIIKNHIKLYTLVCKKCGLSLEGDSSDNIFTCLHCRTGYFFSNEIEEIELFEKQGSSDNNTIILPFYLFNIGFNLKSNDVEKKLYITAFDFRKRALFGDPGLIWSKKGITFPLTPLKHKLTRCYISPLQAENILRNQVVLLWNQTDFNILNFSIVGVPFVVEENYFIDEFTGIKYPLSLL